ncbi:MAG: serine aminopeptidase domain-containing protein [Comamonas sp.]
MAAQAEGRAVEVRWQTLSLPLPGGQGPLVLRQCVPMDAPVRAQLVIAGAIGVPQRFYAAFAQWVAAHGYAVTTFDYRGHGESLQGPLRKAKADLIDWSKDCALVSQYVRSLVPDVPLYWLGHSVGAQLPGIQGAQMSIDGLIAMASGSGYWRDNAPPTRRKVLLWWYGIAPVLTAVCGCLPGKRWGLVGDLPAGVLWQWRRWCLHPNYSIGVEGENVRNAFAQARYPLHAFSVEDDEMMSWRSTTSLVGWYRNCTSKLERLRMLDAPQQRIGHFGFFRADMQHSLWPRALRVLERWQDLARPTEPQGTPSREHRSTGSKMERSRMDSHPGQAELFSESPWI